VGGWAGDLRGYSHISSKRVHAEHDGLFSSHCEMKQMSVDYAIPELPVCADLNASPLAFVTAFPRLPMALPHPRVWHAQHRTLEKHPIT
jgi:hypothetical protein